MYTVYFTDKTEFKGGTPDKSLWGNIPDKEIEKIEYKYTVKPIVFSGYSEYNHLVERIRGVGNSMSFINKIILIGKRENGFDLVNIYFKSKKITVESKRTVGSCKGWKRGIKDRSPRINGLR